ncbi:phage integrase N-terminal SAM-like domain-containing protein [Zoogloea sp.]|uniref:phage integrase N-terminal SAM-like domain-containing protein n=1 Tax=Zoogloea sp. TaxID=49181 RepID=UPI0035B2B740
MSSNLLATPPLSPRLLDLVLERIRVKHYSPRTKKAYVEWIKRHILFHDKPLRRGVGRMVAEVFSSALAVARG